MGYILEPHEWVGVNPLAWTGSIVVAFDDQNRILMQRQKDTGLWSLPRFSSKFGNNAEDSARRESLEETGLVATQGDSIDRVSGETYQFTYQDGNGIDNLAAVYVVMGLTGLLEVDIERLELTWYAPDQIPLELADPITQWVVDHREMLPG